MDILDDLREPKADEIERLRSALQKIMGVNDGERICAHSWGQEYYKRCFDIADEALNGMEGQHQWHLSPEPKETTR